MKKRKPGRPKTGHFKAMSFRLTKIDLERLATIRENLGYIRDQPAKPIDALRHALQIAAGYRSGGNWS